MNLTEGKDSLQRSVLMESTTDRVAPMPEMKKEKNLAGPKEHSTGVIACLMVLSCGTQTSSINITQ